MAKYSEWETDISNKTLIELYIYRVSLQGLLNNWTMFQENYKELKILLAFVKSRIYILEEEEEE